MEMSPSTICWNVGSTAVALFVHFEVFWSESIGWESSRGGVVGPGILEMGGWVPGSSGREKSSVTHKKGGEFAEESSA